MNQHHSSSLTMILQLLALCLLIHLQRIHCFETCHELVDQDELCSATSYPILNISINCEDGIARIARMDDIAAPEEIAGKSIVDMILEYYLINKTSGEVVATEHVVRDSLMYIEHSDLSVTMSNEFIYRFEACVAVQSNPCWIRNDPIIYCNRDENNDTVPSQSYATETISSIYSAVSSSVTISPTLSSSAVILTTPTDSDTPTKIDSSSISVSLTQDIMTTSNRISLMTSSAAHSPTNSAVRSVLLLASSSETTVMVVGTATSSEIISESNNVPVTTSFDPFVTIVILFMTVAVAMAVMLVLLLQILCYLKLRSDNTMKNRIEANEEKGDIAVSYSEFNTGFKIDN